MGNLKSKKRKKSKSKKKVVPVPPAPVVPEKVHQNFFDLVQFSHRSWGREMTREERKHPSMQELEVGAVFLVVDVLKSIDRKLGEISAELARPKKIS